MNNTIEFTSEELQEYGASQAEAAQILVTIKEYIKDGPGVCWKALTKEALHPDLPPLVHQKVFQKLYRQDEKYNDAPPAWEPSAEIAEKSNIYRAASELGMKNYDDFFKWSVSNRIGFWEFVIKKLGIPFKQPFDKIVEFDGSLENPNWIPGAKMNISDACFQADDMEKAAIVYGREDGSTGRWSYNELDRISNRVANGLKDIGFGKGDTAAIDMPMTAEAVAIYLGIVKLGGAVVSIADSLAPQEVMKRLEIAKAKCIFTQDVMLRGKKKLPMYEKLLKEDIPQAIVLAADEFIQVELREDDLSWDQFLSKDDSFESISCEPGDFCNILFSSGTTGEPKAIPWTHTTPIKGAMDGYFHHDIHEVDVVAWPTNIGWMMGPWLIFASLMNKATIALFYGAPTGRPFGEFVERAKVNMLGLVPSMVKRWIETDCMKGLDWSHVKVFSSTGESSNPQDYLWLMARAGYKPVIEYCGGTEIGGGYFTGTIVQPASPATFSTTALGLDLLISNDKGEPAQKGELFIIPPSIGLSTSLLNKDHHETYYANLPNVAPNRETAMGLTLEEELSNLGHPPVIRRHGDEVEQLDNGYFRAHGRADDTMNLGGIKTSSVEIERLLDVLDGIQETAAIAVSPSGGPSQLVVYCVPNEGANLEKDELKSRFQQTIKNQLNPLFKVSDVVITDKLPRTASNKVMRRVLRDEYEAGS